MAEMRSVLDFFRSNQGREEAAGVGLGAMDVAGGGADTYQHYRTAGKGQTRTFLGQVMRGQRSGAEAAAGLMGLGGSGAGMFEGATNIRDADHAKQLIKGAWKPSAMGRRLVSGARYGARGAGAAGALFLPLDIGMRMYSGESAGAATARATGGAIGGAIGGVVGGAIGSALLPGVGTVVGGIVGGAIGYAAGEAVANSGVNVYGHMYELGKRARRTELGGRVSAANMTRASYSMRARALQRINRSGMNSRAMLGQEASLMHMR